MLIVVFSLCLAAFVVMLISGPLRSAQAFEEQDSEAQEAQVAEREADAEESRRAELEAEREAKYREIRDSELDFRTGKLSPADYAAIDGQLRAEALGILNALESLGSSAAHDADEAEQAGSPGVRPRDA
jgi:hypothetical protein